MRCRDYTREVGIATVAERPVPKLVSATIFLVIATLAVLFARQVNSLDHEAKGSTDAAAVKVSSR